MIAKPDSQPPLRQRTKAVLVLSFIVLLSPLFVPRQSEVTWLFNDATLRRTVQETSEAAVVCKDGIYALTCDRNTIDSGDFYVYITCSHWVKNRCDSDPNTLLQLLPSVSEGYDIQLRFTGASSDIRLLDLAHRVVDLDSPIPDEVHIDRASFESASLDLREVLNVVLHKPRPMCNISLLGCLWRSVEIVQVASLAAIAMCIKRLYATQRDQRRLASGRCPSCDYPLNAAHQCAECGRTFGESVDETP